MLIPKITHHLAQPLSFLTQPLIPGGWACPHAPVLQNQLISPLNGLLDDGLPVLLRVWLLQLPLQLVVEGLQDTSGELHPRLTGMLSYAALNYCTHGSGLHL